MFDGLSKKLLSIFGNIRNKGVLTEDVIDSTIREIRISLLEADVALSVVKQFSQDLKEKLKDQAVIKSVTPEQTIIKIVYDELVKLLGSSNEYYTYKSIMLVGLQGSGKTTTAAKLANLFKTKFKNKCLLVPLDTYRPAAITQLEQLAHSSNIDFFNDFNNNDDPLDIATKAHSVANNYDVVIYDTAGRLYVDDKLMKELVELKTIINPKDILLVLDSMMGQDAINTANTFNEQLNISGLILTRVDGDSRGGAALSAKSVTNCQIKFIGTGEKIKDIEIFYPERIASRILDKGDIISLVEKAIDENVAEDISKVKFGKGFDLNSMETYLLQMNKIGGLSGLMKFIPGIKRIQEQLKNNNISDKVISRQIAIIRSMTKKERSNPKILDASRRKRIAGGCGQEVYDVNRLIQQYDNLKKIMTKMYEQGPGFMQNMFNNFKK
ncbi:MAG: signal recognition particle protein [Alphaproteobacteria bacterium]|nr:signal recognition particle protein [Alphaproteobacteria bacterium]